jgi:ribulose-phosphate 3-epimerase
MSVRIAPSILSADFCRLGEEINAVVESGADLIHFDVMDGQFVPNLTMGPPVLASIRSVTEVPLDVHLMIDEPERYVEDFANAGADIISFHVEATQHPHRLIHKIKDLGCQAGIALNPSTSQDEIEYLVDELDMVLVMTVNPGFSGQSFIPDMIEKIRNVRAMMGDRDVEVDGGIDNQTARLVSEAGANILVSGSYIYGHTSYMEAIESLRDYTV